MQIVRFKTDSGSSYGLLEDKKVTPFTDFSFSRSHVEQLKYLDSKDFCVEECKLLAPVQPRVVVGLAYNYKDLVGEMDNYDEPLLFLKSPTGIIADGETVNIPEGCKCWAEVELVIVIGKTVHKLSYGEGERAIYGYLIGNDVTAENIHRRDHHLARSKGHDTFAPVSSVIHTDIDTSKLSVQTYINELKFQDGTTSNMILDARECVELVSQFITLQPGDVIFTGTPKNAMNSIIKDGDTVRLVVENIGELRNFVTAYKL